MKTSELFMDVVTAHMGSPCIDCDFCGRTHFTREAEDIDELRAKAAKDPDRYLESSDDSLAWGVVDGKQYVWHCPCDKLERYEVFIWRHRAMILEYLKKRAEENLEIAQRDAEATRAIP